MKRLVTILGFVALAAVTPSGAGSRVVTIEPAATGTLAFFPVFDILRLQGGDLQSTCFVTTDQNLEWRRSFFEFELPVPARRIVRATLIITETNGVFVPTPLPTDVHEVSAYPGDLVVDLSDYDAPTLPVGTIETDPNDDPNPHSFELDVTRAIRQLRKDAVGFRIKLQVDPDAPCVEVGTAGSAFGGPFFYPPTLRLEVRSGPKD